MEVMCKSFPLDETISFDVRTLHKYLMARKFNLYLKVRTKSRKHYILFYLIGIEKEWKKIPKGHSNLVENKLTTPWLNKKKTNRQTIVHKT